MIDPIETLKAALTDPQIDIDHIGPSYYDQLAKIISQLPTGSIISEWKHKFGGIKYEYHAHTNGIRGQLQIVYEKGIRGGNPQLIKLYSLSDLEKLIQQPL